MAKLQISKSRYKYFNYYFNKNIKFLGYYHNQNIKLLKCWISTKRNM